MTIGLAMCGAGGGSYLPLSGGVLTGPLVVPDGTAALPGIRTTTQAHGIYHLGTGSMGLSAAGVYAGHIRASDAYFNGTVWATNGAFIANGTSYVGWNGASRLYAPANGKVRIANSAVSAGLTIDATLGFLSVRDLGDTGYTHVMCGTVLSYATGDALQLNSGAALLSEISDPGNCDTNRARVYARDNGSGKTQLCVVFGSGAVQVLATEP